MDWVAENKRILPKKEIIRLQNEELQIDLYYNNLSSRQLDKAKQEIKSTFYDFKDQYGIKQYGTDKILSVFIHDNKKEYYDYGYTYASYCISNKIRENTNIANIYHNAGEYKGGDPGNRTMRNQVSYALTYYNNISDDKMLPNKNATIEIPNSNVQVKFGSNSLTDEQVEITKRDIIDTFENIKSNSPIKIELNKYNHLSGMKDNILVEILKETYPGIVGVLVDHKQFDDKAIKEALRHFKGTFPSLAEHVSNHEPFFPIDNQEFLKKVFDNKTVRQHVPIFLSTDGTVERSKKLLSNTEIIEIPRYNFEVELNYRNLNEYQIWRLKQDIRLLSKLA